MSNKTIHRPDLVNVPRIIYSHIFLVKGDGFHQWSADYRTHMIEIRLARLARGAALHQPARNVLPNLWLRSVCLSVRPYFESPTCVLFLVAIVREELQKHDELCSAGHLMDLDRQMLGQKYTTQGRFHQTRINRWMFNFWVNPGVSYSKTESWFQRCSS